MNSRKLFALALVLTLTGGALAATQSRLFRTVDDDDNTTEDPLVAQGVVAIQQHSVFVEIILEVRQNVTQIHQFAAVVGLAKKCRQVRNVFDNAVLWFNDQFLFGNKSNVTVNVTPPNAMGRNPNRTHTLEDLLDPNRNNGTGAFNPATGGAEVDQVGVGPNEGGNPDRDGFIRAQDFRERWGGCFIPNGFIHAIGVDDPYSTGQVATVEADVVTPGPDVNLAKGGIGLNNIGQVKNLITADNLCGGCVFAYVGTFYITDPNNHRWMVDKLIYPVDIAGVLGIGDDPTNCHYSFAPFLGGGLACGTEADRHRDRAEDNGIPNGQTFDDPRPDDDGDGVQECADADGDGDTECEENDNENFDNHCNEDSPDDECLADGGDPTDVPGADECFFGLCGVGADVDGDGDDDVFAPVPHVEKFTTKEPIYTVHLQVDPWNPDRQGFPDEAIWVYREDGKRRIGLPYTEDPTHFCHDAATVELGKPAAYEYDYLFGEGGPAGPIPAPDGTGADESIDWAEYRRGPVGNTVECAIEYNFLIAVDFEAFDNVNVGQAFVDEDEPGPLSPDPPGDVGSVPGVGAMVGVGTQEEDPGENEIQRDLKHHGDGGADDADPAAFGNSHPHSPTECQRNNANNTIECEPAPTCPPEPPANPPSCTSSGPQHKHDALTLDLFFHPTAPFFVMENPYWDHANETDALVTTGTPPRTDDLCITAPDLAPDDYRRQAVEARVPIVCDVDAVDGFHLHDGTQTIPR